MVYKNIRIIILMLVLTSCQIKESTQCIRYDFYKGRKSCVVGEVILQNASAPDFLREIEEVRKNPRMEIER